MSSTVKLTKTQEVHILGLQDEDGCIDPRNVLEDAKKSKSPLHGLYNWDVKKAAAAHWMEQTRRICRSVTVPIITEHIQVRTVAMVRDPDKPSAEAGYRLIERLRQEPASAMEAARYEFERAGAALSRARIVAVSLGLADDIDFLLERVTGLRDKVIGSPPPSDGGDPGADAEAH